MTHPSHYNDNEMRRRVQQKIVDRFSATNDDNSQISDSKVHSVKKSPYSFENFVWLFGSLMVFYFSDIVSVLLYDGRVKQPWYWIGIGAFIFHLCAAFFLVFWLSFWNKVDTNDWETKYPKVVPLATASFTIGFICMTVALWPVWGFLAPAILGALFMGGVVLIAMCG